MDLTKNNSKLHIIEQEFKFAEKAQNMQQLEEGEMRVRCGHMPSQWHECSANHWERQRVGRSV